LSAFPGTGKPLQIAAWRVLAAKKLEMIGDAYLRWPRSKRRCPAA
jgi:hypothetical protein